MKNLGKTLLFLLLLVLAFLNSMLSAHVMLDIGKLYKLSFITNFSFVQLIGISYLLALIFYKTKKYEFEAEKTFSGLLKKGYGQILDMTIFILFNWGLAILAFKMLS